MTSIRVDADNGDLILPVGMKMRDMVLSTHLGEHADDNSVEAAEFRHLESYTRHRARRN